MFLTGGTALVSGKFIQKNSETVTFPIIKELNVTQFNVNWALCINSNSEYQPIPLLDFDNTVPTPNNPSRVFTALNLVNGQTYSLDASTFSDLINNRKDLTILYLITSNTAVGSPPTISLTIADARRYINDADTNLPLKLTSAQSQGNFRSLTSILNWVRFNNLFNSTAIVKGTNSTNGVVNSPLTLDFPSAAIIDGQNDALLTFNSLVTIGSNVTIKNLAAIFNGGISIVNDTSNLIFDNCIITINVPVITPSVNTIFNFVNGNIVTFNKCLLNIIFTDQVSGRTVFRATNTANFSIMDSALSVSYDGYAGVITPGNIFNFNFCPGIIIQDCAFSGNFNQLINNNNSPNMQLINSVVTSTYNPNAGVTPDTYNSVPYSSSNLVNSGQGYIYSNINGILDAMTINNVTFNYAPTTSNGDRYSFINFELSNSFSVLSNLIISNCKFNHLNVGGLIEDYRSAIAIINTSSAIANTNTSPILLNANISNNFCNRNQSIIITSNTDGYGVMQYPGLEVLGSSIKNNICGTIGYWSSAGYKVANIPPNVNIFTDRSNGLLIDNNICHYIANLDSHGQYFLVSKAVSGATHNQSAYPSGYVTINNNKTNWIHTGIAYQESSSLNITNNVLTAYDTLYLFNYNDLYPNAAYNPTGIGLSTGYAIFVSSEHHLTGINFAPFPGPDGSCIISGNTTDSGYFLESNSTKIIYKYPFGYIYSQASATITNNILQGIDNVVTAITNNGFSSLVLLGGVNHIVTNNRIYRNHVWVYAYITYAVFEIEGNNGSGSSGIIENNFFDSMVTNDLQVTLSPLFPPLINFSLAAGAKRWIAQDNINQSKSSSIMLLEAIQGAPAPGGPGSISNPMINMSTDVGNMGIDIAIKNSLPASPQYYARSFVLNNYIPYGTPRIYSLSITITTDGSLGGGAIVFNDTPSTNEILLEIVNHDLGGTTISLPITGAPFFNANFGPTTNT